MYSNGVSETIVGKALTRFKIPRDRVVIMTKCRFAVSDPDEPQLGMFESRVNDGLLVNRVGLSRKHIFDAVQASVKRLGTYIDVLQIHRMDRDVPREETMRALNDVVEMGWVRYIGGSSVRHKLSFNPGLHDTRVLTSIKDAYLGVPSHAERCQSPRVAPIHFDAELLQPPLSRRRTRDDPVLQGCRYWFGTGKLSANERTKYQ